MDYKEDGTITMYISAFKPIEHKLGWCPDSVLCLIDKQPFFGTDLTVPFNTLDKLTFAFNGIETNLDVSGMYNPWNGNHAPMNAFKITNRGYVTEIVGYFSDGAGSYTAKWQVIHGTSIRTRLDIMD